MARASQPLPYTASPYKLAFDDLILWFRITFVLPPNGIPSTILPILPFRSGALDELYPTPANIWNIILQLLFTIAQAIFLISLPVTAVTGINVLFPFILLPPFLSAYVPLFTLSIVVFVLTNRFLSILLLDGTDRHFVSNTPLTEADILSHKKEKWLFVNGVACGSHWIQSNLDRLSLTFRREIEGIHNQTRGIVFDLLEVVLERTFSYATPSTRMVYARLLNVISDPQYEKIVLICHSQGAIEGGLALDWLFATVPAEQLRRVEVYTFGCAANHFNNPVASGMDAVGNRIDLGRDDNIGKSIESSGDNESSTRASIGGNTMQQGRTLGHVEHYANSGDYVSEFGILHFRPLPTSMLSSSPYSSLASRRSGMYMHDLVTNQTLENRYVGRLFIRNATGHLLNGNYLDYFFPMDEALTEVLDDGSKFMDGVVDQTVLEEGDIVIAEGMEIGIASRTGNIRVTKGTGKGKDVKSGVKSGVEIVKVKELSRLWSYRNGMSPKE